MNAGKIQHRLASPGKIFQNNVQIDWFSIFASFSRKYQAPPFFPKSFEAKKIGNWKHAEIFRYWKMFLIYWFRILPPRVKSNFEKKYICFMRNSIPQHRSYNMCVVCNPCHGSSFSNQSDVFSHISKTLWNVRQKWIMWILFCIIFKKWGIESIIGNFWFVISHKVS